jgi:O-antigen/teichoic acid export membrane protein
MGERMRPRLSAGVNLVRGNAKILLNSGFLALGSAIAAGLGFAFWWIAARVFPPATVGLQSALVSAMAFVGLLGEAGFGTMLIGSTAGQPERVTPLISAAMIAGTAAAFVLAIPVSAFFYLYGWMGVSTAAFFAVGCGLTALSYVLDQVFVGLMRSKLQFYRSLLFSTLKLGFLLAAAFVTEDRDAILLTWISALGLSIVVSFYHAWHGRVLRPARPDFSWLARELRVVVGHHLLNMATMAPALLLPLAVSFCLGTEINAAFYAGWMVLTIALLVPASLTTVLFSVAATDPAALPEKLRLSMLVSAGFGVVSAIGLAVLGDFILFLFNPQYPDLAGAAVRLFGIGLLLSVVKQHYILLARAQHRMSSAALWLGLGGCLEVGLAVAGGLLGDVRWLTIGWISALAIEAAFLALPLLRYTRPTVARASA